MKRKIQLLCLFVCMAFGSFAQLKEGVLTYDMSFSTNNPDMAPAISMMQGSKMIMSFMPGKTRSEVTMGMMSTVVTIADEKSKKAIMLMNVMGSKYAMNTELDKDNGADKSGYETETTGETKDIMGYTCTKVIMTDEQGSPITMWVTKEISAYTKGQKYHNPDVEGFPMSISMSQNDMNIDMTVTAVNKKVDKKVFNMKIPEGYQLTTEEEMMMMIGQ